MAVKNVFERKIIVTGGAGFIGANLLHLMIPKYPQYLFINIDCLSYAGNLLSLKGIENRPNYKFEKIDITDNKTLTGCFEKYRPDGIIHLAAETHVDKSITRPTEFINTNIIGTFNLLELVRQFSDKNKSIRYHHVSTDEVFGSVNGRSHFTEQSQYRPNSPYAASKAAADHLARAWHKTYGLDIVVTNCCNNFGPYQYPEKLIPLTIRNAKEGLLIPIYGDGKNIRDWIYVEDHCRAVDTVFHNGQSGRTYNIGARTEIENIETVRMICRIMDELLEGGPREKLIKFVEDRPGHDRRYAIDPSLIETELNWKPECSFEDGLKKTVKWYLDNPDWMESCINGQYLKYYEELYSNR